MSDSGDYLDEMKFNDHTDRDIERLLDGSLDAADDLVPVADLFESLRTEATSLDEATLAGFIHSASTASATATRQRVADGGVAVPVMGADGLKRGSLLVSLRRRVAAIAVAAAVFVGGLSGVAVAADHAKPGDALYGIDRALEAVGIGNGRAAERFVEAQALFEADEAPRGLQHAAEAVETHGSDRSAASDALAKAAARMASDGSVQSAATRASVAGLLSYLMNNGDDFDGRQVAEFAREIGRPDDLPNTPPEVTPPSAPGSPDRRPTNPPGRPDFTPGSPNTPSNRP